MEEYFVRIKPVDTKRGLVLKRYTYKGIKFQADRGWYRVQKPVADHLRAVRQTAGSEQPAFDVCTVEQAQGIDAEEKKNQDKKQLATADVKLSVPREGVTTTADLAGATSTDDSDKPGARKRGQRS